MKDEKQTRKKLMDESVECHERKKAEETLRESEELLKAVLDASDEIIFAKDLNSRYTHANATFSKKFNRPLGEIVGKTDEDIFTDKEARLLREIDLKVFKKGKIDSREDVLVVDGETRIFKTTKVPVRNKDGRIIGLSGFARDITESKRAEKVQSSVYKISEAAHSSKNLEELYHLIHHVITELMPAKNNFYIALYNSDSDMIDFAYFVDEYEDNPGPQKFGKGLTEYVIRTGKPLLAPPEVLKKLEKEGEIELIGPPSIDWLGVPLITKEKTIGVLAVQSYTEGLRYSEEDKDILTFISDQIALVIERKQAEERLRAEMAYLEQLFESAQEAIVMNTTDGRILNVNSEFVRMFGYAREEAIGKFLDDLVATEYLMEEAVSLTKRIAEGEKVKYETVRCRKDGTQMNVSLLGSPIIIDDEQVGVYSIYRDITEHKQAEDKIKASLKERNVMLREIHHRVKNNMQIISSLLRLQSRLIKDNEMLEIFKECQNRIRSIALIHEALYQSKDLARINFSDYINRLTTHLFAIYRERASGINFDLNVGEVHIDINKAIPCGLVISELVSNSLKHAFPGARKGQIVVKMNMNKKGRYTLIVRDTGVGLPELLDFRKPETLGLQLVNDLVNQIGGTIELDREGGTIFTIIF